MNIAYIYALSANLCFSVGVQFFTHYTRSLSSSWVNCYKALTAALLFGLTVAFFGGFHPIAMASIGLFFLSGALGLGTADVFMLKSFALMGPGRTMMIYGFQPLIIGVISYLLFGQVPDTSRLAAIFFFIICLFIFSLESFRKHGHWNMRAIVFALSAVIFDAVGVVITRYTFDINTGIATTEGNFYRALGAILFFIVLSFVRPFYFFSKARTLGTSGIAWVTVGSIMGTFLSLFLYLNALRHAPSLAAVSGIAITGTIFAAAFECIIEKKPPSKYLAVSFVFFLIGMKFLLF